MISGQLVARLDRACVGPGSSGSRRRSREATNHTTWRVQARADLAEPHSELAATRRQVQLLLLGTCLPFLTTLSAEAIGFKKELKRKSIPLEEYSTREDGLRFYDLTEGRGQAVEAGSPVLVHFDCKYKGIDAVSSRAARTLGGNRTVAEPYEFIAAGEVSNKGRKIQDSAGGLFAGGGGPKPPPALSTAVIGMKAGGKRTVKVPPELGYGDRGEQEIPPGATFDLLIEVLRVGE